MSVSERDKQRRLILAGLMVEILRPVEGDRHFNMIDQLIGYCVALSSFGPHRMGLNKIAEVVDKPRATVKRSLDRLIAMRAVARDHDGTYVVDAAFSQNAGRALEIDRKIGAIIRAAKELELMAEPVSDYEGSGI